MRNKKGIRRLVSYENKKWRLRLRAKWKRDSETRVEGKWSIKGLRRLGMRTGPELAERIEGGGGGVEGKHCICWLMKDGIRNCSILVLGILGVSEQALGMNSRHYSFRSLVYNCIFHLSTGWFKIVRRKKHRLPRVSVHCNHTTKLKIMSADNLERDNSTGTVMMCYFSLQNIKVLFYFFNLCFFLGHFRSWKEKETMLIKKR